MLSLANTLAKDESSSALVLLSFWLKTSVELQQYRQQTFRPAPDLKLPTGAEIAVLCDPATAIFLEGANIQYEYESYLSAIDNCTKVRLTGVQITSFGKNSDDFEDFLEKWKCHTPLIED